MKKTSNWIIIGEGDRAYEGDLVGVFTKDENIVGTLKSIEKDMIVVETEDSHYQFFIIDDILKLETYEDKKSEKIGKTRSDILEQARVCVCGHRENEYGSPEDNFKTIANLWSSYKDVEFTATDVAMMMALLKIARVKGGNATEDSFVDLAGYAACGGEISLN